MLRAQSGAGEQGYMEQRLSFQLNVGIIDGCFKDCVKDFSKYEISAKETSCLKNCGVRSYKTSESFGEHM